MSTEPDFTTPDLYLHDDGGFSVVLRLGHIRLQDVIRTHPRIHVAPLAAWDPRTQVFTDYSEA